MSDTSTSGTEQSEAVPPETYKLYDEESREFTCPFCGGRVLRISDCADCLGECGRVFDREDPDSLWKVDESSRSSFLEALGVER